MKKYLVMRKYNRNGWNPEYVAAFDDERKAMVFCELSQENDDTHTYAVYNMMCAVRM